MSNEVTVENDIVYRLIFGDLVEELEDVFDKFFWRVATQSTEKSLLISLALP